MFYLKKKIHVKNTGEPNSTHNPNPIDDLFLTG